MTGTLNHSIKHEKSGISLFLFHSLCLFSYCGYLLTLSI